MPVSAALGLLFAVLFDARFPLRELFKALYFAPMVTSTVAAAVVWWWLYNPQFGLFNVLLRMVGLPIQPWLMSSRTALLSIILFSVWKGVGYNMVVYLAGLQAIPESFVEAARIDGAGAFQRFRRITLPLLAPTTAFLLIYNSIQAFQVFDQVFVLDQRGARGLDQRHRARSVPAGLRAVQLRLRGRGGHAPVRPHPRGDGASSTSTASAYEVSY